MTCDSHRSTAVHHSIARVSCDSTEESPAVIAAHDCSSGRIDGEGLVAGVGHDDPAGEVLEPHRLVAEVHVAGADEPHRVVVRRHGDAVRPRALAGQDGHAGVVRG